MASIPYTSLAAAMTLAVITDIINIIIYSIFGWN